MARKSGVFQYLVASSARSFLVWADILSATFLRVISWLLKRQHTAATHRPRSTPITGDSYTLIGLGLGALLIVWLVFSVLKKLIGFAFLAALVVGAIVLWRDPALLAVVVGGVQGMLGMTR